MALSDVFIIFIFLVEVIILTKFEIKIWGTLFTPLNILMIPYTIVLLITIALPKSLGFVEFYYPSIIFWMVGLIVFFLPSLLIGLKYNQQCSLEPVMYYEDVRISKLLLILISFFLFFSLIHIFLTSGSSANLLGSDEYAEDNLAGGLWGHIREFLIASLILLIFDFDKAKWKYIFLIFGILVVAMLYQVKSWIIIPLIAGFLYRFFSKKSKLNPFLILLIIISGGFIFFLSYYLLLVASVDGELTNDTSEFIVEHFLHYLTSGVNGLSVDMRAGFLETPKPEYVFAPFINIVYMFTGDKLIIPISDIYHDTGLGGTNVLTFFGTLFIHLGMLGSILYVLLFSGLIYLLLKYVKSTSSMYFTAIYVWWCSLLFMGWFEFYFWNLSFIEIPIFYLLINSLDTYIKIPKIKLR